MTYLERARQRIPSATQTYSKSHTRFPAGAPEYINRAEGAYVYDERGKPWLDGVSGLGSVILGHCDPDVDRAVRHQLLNGVGFPLPSLLELQLAERICQMVPSAEMVRFAKNGADACAAAVRIARDVTGRERILSIGYHGFHDYTIAHQNPRGVPQDSFDKLWVPRYGDLTAAARSLTANTVACLIMEPIVATNPEPPPPGYLEAIRELCTRTGTLLIFDEVVTFGRHPEGTAQKYYGVTPDLTALGKCLANGLPLSAVCGRADLMRTLEEGVFFSTTFGGETLALAAGIATLDKLVREDVTGYVNEVGATLGRLFREIASANGLAERVTLKGYPSRMVWSWNDPEDARVFGESLIASKVLAPGYLNVTYAMKDAEIEQIAQAWIAGMNAVSQRQKVAA